MAKIKIYELAKELGAESKDILRKLQKMNVSAKSHMSTISAKDADAIRREFVQKADGTAALPGDFVPRVKRIPKSVVELEIAAQAVETPDIDDAPAAAPAPTAPATQQPAAEAAPVAQPITVSGAKPDTKPESKTDAIPPIVQQVVTPVAKPAAQPVVVPVESAAPTAAAPPSAETPSANAASAGKPAEQTQTAASQPAASRPQGGSQGQGNYGDRPRPQGGQGNYGDRPRPQGQGQGNYGDRPRPQGQGQGGYAGGQRPQGQGGYAGGQRPQGQGGYAGGQRPQGQGQGGYAGGQRPQGQGGYAGGQRPQGQGGYAGGQRPQGQGQGGYAGGQRPQGQGQGGYAGGPRPQGQGQGGYAGGQRPQGQGQGGYAGGQRPQGQGQGGYAGGQRPQGQGQGGYAGGPRPQGQGQGRPQGSPGQGRPQGGASRGPGARGGLNIPPPAVAQEKPSNYRPPANKKNLTKDQILERANENDKRGREYRNNKGKKDKYNKKGRRDAKAIMPPVVPKKIMIAESVVLSELAHAMGKTAAEIIKKLFEMGIMATINQELDSETAILLADEFGITVEVTIDKTVEIMEDIEDEDAELAERPPVVTIMGHVDHGKTSLLDAIRHTNVISTEAGGITQHIGAYQVEIKGKKITFLDTPGHEAFTAMRARGAQMTDVAIIVVAADDGVMPQTVEAINHSKAAGVPVIIAINKIDKPGANLDRVKQELTEHGLVGEEWGGDTVMVPVSAKARQNIEGLLEMILLVAEVAELRANPDRQARGTVVESRLDKNRGPVVTLLVQKGTLHVGDNLLAGPVFGKVRAMTDDRGRKVRAAGPSMPVEVMGFSEVPSAGEIFISAKDDKDARFVAQRQQIKKREEELHKTARVSLDDLFKKIAEGEIKELNLVVKADVHGSVEALQQSLVKLNTEEVKVRVIHAGVGGISESDVMLATASNAIIIGFNVRPMPAAVRAAEQEKVDIRLYRVIYDAIEDIKKAMSGLLKPEFKEQVIGHAEVRAVFKVPKAGMVAGSHVQEGKITRNAQVRVVRDSVVIAEDKIDSLRRFKDDVKEVLTGFECGIGLESFNDIKEGDIIEAFIMEEIKREL